MRMFSQIAPNGVTKALSSSASATDLPAQVNVDDIANDGKRDYGTHPEDPLPENDCDPNFQDVDTTPRSEVPESTSSTTAGSTREKGDHSAVLPDVTDPEGDRHAALDELSPSHLAENRDKTSRTVATTSNGDAQDCPVVVDEMQSATDLTVHEFEMGTKSAQEPESDDPKPSSLSDLSRESHDDLEHGGEHAETVTDLLLAPTNQEEQPMEDEPSPTSTESFVDVLPHQQQQIKDDHAFQDYQMQLMLLEQQNRKKRLLEADDATSEESPADGSHKLQNYQVQLMLLEQEHKKKLLEERPALDATWSIGRSDEVTNTQQVAKHGNDHQPEPQGCPQRGTEGDESSAGGCPFLSMQQHRRSNGDSHLVNQVDLQK